MHESLVREGKMDADGVRGGRELLFVDCEMSKCDVDPQHTFFWSSLLAHSL